MITEPAAAQPLLAKSKVALAGLSATVAYWIAFSTRSGAAAILLALPCIFLLHRVRTPRQAFYVGLVTGIAMYAPPLAFFHRVFGPAALALYLIAGLPIAFFVLLMHDTAFVVGPDGRDVFEQGKSVPVQFMQDGLPAEHRRVWDSPWGKIGIAVCYDVSYSRVMDDFVRQGAQALIIPTEDDQSWSRYERTMLHGRMAPIRSAEYGIPVFGVWSSGVSQLTDRCGNVIATAGYPGQGETIAGPMDLKKPGRIPPDRMAALACSLATGVFFLVLMIAARTR